jgi:fibro-slime domain-containing protein
VATGDDGGGGGDPDAAPGWRPDAGTVADDCHALPMTLRDFSPSTHPDFEPPSDSDFAYPGLVESTLGNDDKPVYAHPGATPHTAGPVEFAQWYRDTDGINQAFASSLPLVEASPGRFVFDSAAFFPLDGMGFGDEGLPHNFHFTTEIHTTFEYRGGEAFTFTGDDDLWLFINDRLAIDLGGLHPSLSATVDLDASAAQLGITPGQTYPMAIFHAERHTDASNFHVETTIDCFVVP